MHGPAKIFILTFVLLALTGVAGHFYLSGRPLKRYLADSPETELRAHAAELELLQAKLLSWSFFRGPRSFTQDARDFFAQGPLEQHIPEAFLAELVSSKPLTQIALNWKQWRGQLDFFREARAFDHWSYEPTSTADDEYRRLVLWCKLRLLHGRDHQDLRRAEEELTHFAQLLLTHETPQASGAVLAIFRSMLQIGVLPAGMQESQVALFETYLAQLAKLSDLRLSDELFQRFADSEPLLCQRVYLALRSALEAQQLFVGDFAAQQRRLAELEVATRSRCRASQLRASWRASALP